MEINIWDSIISMLHPLCCMKKIIRQCEVAISAPKTFVPYSILPARLSRENVSSDNVCYKMRKVPVL